MQAGKFPAFPYKPYSIQIDFMNALYHSLNKGGVSMLESPTGTGKTLSIICSALQWVVDRRQQQNFGKGGKHDKNQENDGQHGSDDEPDWMRDFVVNKDNHVQEKKNKMKKFGKPDKRRNQESCRDLFSRVEGDGDLVTKKEREISQKNNDAVELSDEEFLLEDYESEEEGAGGKSKRKAGRGSLSSSSDEEEEEDQSDEEEDKEKLKVYFCSRTHSQLSQFVKELRKTVFSNEMKIVCLGSRKNFCINEEVLKLGNSTRINERCLELQKNKKKEVSKIKNLGGGGRIRRTKASSGCPMLRKPKLQRQFRSEISQQGALDIEDLIHLGVNMGTCPYYASRGMVPAADLVVLPYQSLLSKSSRESLGLTLKNNIVIIDEAHNLADSLISMYDSKVTVSQLENVHSHTVRYFERFRNLLGPGNRRYIQTLMVLTRAFLQILLEDASYVDVPQDTEKASGANDASNSSMAINDFLFSLNVDNINLVKLLQYIKESNIMYKIVDQAHAVVLAGGTLQPIEETRERLFPWLPPNELHFFSCSHIVPPESILPVAVSCGPSGQSFDFSYGSRSSSIMIQELGLLLCNLVTVVPEGIVLFFSSFEYEGQVYDGWKASGLLERIMKKKRVFREPRKSTDVESVLKEYKETIDTLSLGNSNEHPASQSGAILFAVVGGKLSEGINLSDGMGRCVVMVGLPYPSPSDIELIERVKHIEGLGNSDSIKTPKFPVTEEVHSGDVKAGFEILRGCRRRGKEYYENLCMKAVNQSIGRAIRHVNDYAAILLVDTRYASNPSNRSFSHTTKLPQWIKDCLISSTVSYGEVHRLLHQFFKFNKKRESH
ncbi:uncharacterized protein LOC132186105 isoform X3 [Corylus avellana]|uniref:uncharacterized protein LOC132186105 isoform X3 n=1 Tax=Corylus avellana TaxID=13451 RepID=UPI00286AD328|nr:uncharacterized protein LOC132186105 isoform X3 [Corylus avellana]